MGVFDKNWNDNSKNNIYNFRNQNRPKPVLKFAVWFILIIYLLWIYKYADINNALFFKEEYSFEFIFYIKSILKNPYSVNISGIITLMAVMIPVGLFIPLAKQKRCLSGTLILGEILVLTIDIAKINSRRGIVCIDNLFIGLLGTYLGYRLFVYLSRKSSDGFLYLSRGSSDTGKGWIGVLLLLLIAESVIWNINVENNGLSIGDRLVNNANKTSKIESDEEDNTSTKNVRKSENYVYDTMYNQIIQQNIYINLSGRRGQLTGEYINEQYAKILQDHPEIFWLNGGASVTGTSSMFTTDYTYKLYTNCEIKNVPKMKDEMDHVINRIVESAMKYESDFKKALFVHDYLVRMCEYDTDTYNSSKNNDPNNLFSMAYTAYGCLVENKAVCSGYAKAYQLIMNELGIECGFVTGIGINYEGSGPHAWNYINIDGKYYYVDVTWDDPIYSGPKPKDISHKYFCISKEEISRDHSFDKGQFVP
ncbi:MAG: hypothetical protein MJZ11_12230 [Lachnospiraceae bacterium]|nr:hypothetical protein [Lachnospiraceae bacterium]